MAEIGLTSELRVVVGERLEVTRQSLDPSDPLGICDEATCKSANLESTDQLPALGIVYSATQQTKLRASVTRTLARPQLRELAPFTYTDYFGGRQVFGKPELKLTHITNGDLRFEYFPTLKEVLAFSFFAKDFEDPIEPVVRPQSTSQLQTFQNSPGARLIGIELEARKQLGFLASALEDFTVIGNLTLARSRIQIEQTDRGFITNLSRSLANQAPYVINLALDYEADFGLGARVLYNVSGARIVEVGADGLDDAYEHPRHLIDISVSQSLGEHFQVKATAENVLNSEVLITQGPEARDDNITRQYAEGVAFSVGASYTY
jgi:outer membrane receptor protein involved in Fe transport